MLGTILAAGFAGFGLMGNPPRRRKHRRRNPESADGTAERELMLYIVNDSGLYSGQTKAILTNLRKKIKKGVYDSTKAVKLWGYLADAGAKKYTKEMGGEYGRSSGHGSYGAFSATTRRAVAKELAEYYDEELKESVNPRHRRNPHDVTTTVHDIGDVRVIINQWRNRSATAFITVSTEGPKGVKSWEAKSQGPSAGGYHKPTQAAERVYHKITGTYEHNFGGGKSDLEAIAKAAAKALNARTNPRRRR